MSSRFYAFVAIVSTLLEQTCPERTDGNRDFLITGSCGQRQAETVSERIINGTDAVPGDWPWMVGLYTPNDTFHCGGVLISNQYIVTAAHCFGNKDSSFLSVRLGSTNKTDLTVDCCLEPDQKHEPTINQGSKVYVTCVDIAEVCIPVQEDCNFFMEDIAVVRLKKAVNFTKNIQPICLPENCEEPSFDTTTYIAGWGRVYEMVDYEYYDIEDEEDEQNTSNENERSADEGTTEVSSQESTQCVISFLPTTLRQRNITFITKNECQRQLITNVEGYEKLGKTVPDYTICATGGACFGDSGGPLMYQKNGSWYLLGIISTGAFNCCHPERPARHIIVSYFIERLILPFMQRSTSSNAKEDPLCATDEARKKCVTDFYASFNMSVEA